MPERRVFCINKGGHDYSDAERFGPITFCTEGSLAKSNTSQMYRMFKECFVDSTAGDYILLTSLTTACSIACAIFAVMHGRLNLLIYKDGAYIERVVKLD